ncbi:MAG: alpha/beta fold hydrolase, partial [Burkholderiaceae bacterium]|nr:alpha/beta fold hydrolase [Burkholderiaceae bacterium]
RTPDSCFSDLPDFAYTPHYIDLPDCEGLRMAWVEEGPSDGPVALLLHGEPTWGYLYRKMIPGLVARGMRVVVPDLIGFGRSDKPSRMEDYSYARHVHWLTTFLKARGLTGMTLFCQDWGSLLGLRVVAENPHLFERVMVSNGFLPTGDRGANRAFLIWQAFARFSPVFPIGRIVNSGCVQKLSDAEIAAYDAPYPENRFKAGARMFPRLVPTSADNPASEANRKAWAFFEQST